MAERPEVDLSGGKYDDFETMLSQKLGLKVILMRGWRSPDSLFIAETDIMQANMYGAEEQKKEAREKFAKTEAAMLGEKRANLSDRDPQVGMELTDNDLRALQKTGHITLRHGNAEREQAVIVLDPGDNPYFDKDPVLRFALNTHFENAWDIHGDDGVRNISVRDFIENFEMDAEDKRRYQAVLNVRYALQNQSEYNNKGKGWYYEPFYYNFAGLSDKEPGMWESSFKMSFAAVADKRRVERVWKPEGMGINDPAFLDKITLAGAIMDLNYHILDTHPYDTFARLGFEHSVTPKQIIEIQQDLHKRLEAKYEEHRGKATDESYDYGLDSRALADWRILFPVFREVYEADKSEGPQRKYLDTIMEGLQKWFPTLTNGPVPDVTPGATKEPSRSIPKAATTPQLPKKPADGVSFDL